MNKSDFLGSLEKYLKALKKADRTRFLDYYREMIDDYMEDGCTEEEAIRRIGSPEKIAQEICAEQDSSSFGNKPTSFKVLITILLILGSPLWGAILLAALCLAASGIILILCGYIIIWCVPLTTGALSVFSLFTAIVSMFGAIPLALDNLAFGILTFGSGIGMIGVFLLTFIFTWKTGKYFVNITVRFTNWLIRIIQRKRGVTA